MNEIINNKNLAAETILAFLKLSRAMRRCPPPRRDFPFPPAVGRLLESVASNPGVSSRELCEALDLRPSSLSEILVRSENDGLLSRAADEHDRRVQRVGQHAEDQDGEDHIQNSHSLKCSLTNALAASSAASI